MCYASERNIASGINNIKTTKRSKITKAAFAKYMYRQGYVTEMGNIKWYNV
jgi:hypothetical protein